MWCPTGINPGSAGCTASTLKFNGVGGLLSLISGKTVPGTIWIETTYSSVGEGGPVTLNNSLGTTSNFALTVKGGWNGSLGGAAAITGTSTFNVPLTINWNADVTLNDIEVSGIASAGTAALTITTPKNITLNRVHVHTNSGAGNRGASLDDTVSSGTGDVNITSSEFAANNSDNLSVKSNGTITLTNVLAFGSVNGSGAILDNSTGTLKSVTLNGNNSIVTQPWLNGGVGVPVNSFDSNFNNGLQVLSKGPITISNLIANNNANNYGAQLNNTFSGTGSPQAVTLTGINQFNTNHLDGLNVASYGAVSLAGLTANNSASGNGVYVDNRGNLITPPDVNVTGINQFNNNWFDGLDIFTNGAISLSNVTATGDGQSAIVGFGVYLDNCNFAGTCANLTTKPVTLTGTNNLSFNFTTGLLVRSKGVITISNLTANANTHGFGAKLDNHFLGTALPQAVTLTGVNQFNTNYFDGLNVVSNGAVSLASLTANNNGTVAAGGSYGYGVNVDNLGNLIAPPDVTVSGTNQFNNNWLSGLEILTNGAISLNNVTATTNGQSSSFGYGVYLDNCNFVAACANLTTKPVTLTGTNNLSTNYTTGLFVNSKGIITISNLTANSNTNGYGAWLDNHFLGTALPQAVTLTGVNQFNGNPVTGLRIVSNGAVSLASITANNSTSGYGVSVNNRGSLLAPADVNVTGTNQFNTNFYDGLNILSYGAISLNNVTATNNGQGHFVNFDYGVNLDNCTPSGSVCTNTNAKAVTLTGINYLLNNYDTGLFVKSKGAITVDDLSATGNTNGYGAWLENDYTGSVGLITINGGLFYPNGLGPLHILSNIADVYISAPMWCPVGVTPGAATCSHTIYPSLAALALGAGVGFTPNVPGVIWIQNSTFASTGAILFDGNAGWALYSANALTFQGGWSGLGTTIISSTPSVIQDPLSIVNWHANVTLNDIEIKNISTTGPAALTITTTKNITLTRVHVHDNTGINRIGASLDGTFNSGTGNVIVTSSEFDNNYGNNLNIVSNGSITLTNILALGSTHGSGAVLDNHLSATPMSVTVTGDNSYLTLAWINSGAGDFVNSFSNNFNDGLQVSSIGTITLMNITANHNGASGGTHSFGAEVTNDFSPATAGVTLTGLNIFNENFKDGLFIKSLGPVIASNLTADSNGSSGSGVEIDNHDAITAQPVTLTGSGEFKSNYQSGLSILSNGLITLNNLIADKNLGSATPCPGNPSNPALSSCSGVYLYNSYPTYSSGVTITGSNEFNFNNNYGLLIHSNGIVSLANLTANGDGVGSGTGYAVYVDNSTAPAPKAVTISGANSMDANRKGLYVSSIGAITANNVSVTQSTGSDGALLKNDNPGGVGDVTLTGINTFNGNDNGNGLIITSFGAISLSSVTAQNNGYSSIFGAGINLDNHASTLAMPPGVTLSGTYLSYNNGEDGVVIQTKGLVTVSNLTANSNGYAAIVGHESGLNVVNTFGTAGVTLTGTNTFNSNYLNGIWVTSKGPITISNVTADYNDHGNGADLVNTAGIVSSPQNVTITGTNDFNSNNSDGLVIQTYGVISINNVTSDDSITGSGAILDNHTGTLVEGVMLTGTNTFDYNHVDGLDVTSLGQITASNLNTYNTYTGNSASLNNSLGTAGVTLSGTNTFDFTLVATGLLIQTRGAISISNVTADNNSNTSGYYGLDLENWSALSPQPVTLTGTNELDDNYNSGLFIRSIGLVTISNLTASHDGSGSGSDGYGLEVSNLSNTTGVNLTGSNYFYHNYTGGLSVYSKGPITLNSISATYSTMTGSIGASLNNLASTPLSPQNVTITGTNDFSSNDGDGLDIKTYGAISLNNVTSNASVNGSGASLDNSTGTTAKTVTLTGTNEFNSNQVNGLSILSLGLITTSNLTASNNFNGRGASFDNHLGTGGVTLSGTLTFNTNPKGTGLYIVSRGAITITSITSLSNGNAAGEYGAYLDNSAGSAQPVTLTGTNDVESNYDSGLYIKSSGLVTISNLTASSNGTGLSHGYGLDISIAAANTGVNITGSNTFYNNYSGGLSVYSKGPITLNSISANQSTNAGATGAILNNLASTPLSPQNVTITGTNDFGSNDGDGLDIQTYGAISLNNVTSNYSVNGSGASLNNSTGTTAKTVTLTGTNGFNNNHVNGLSILSLGLISASNLTASSNTTGRGVSFDNHLGTGGVTLTGTNTFNNNSQDTGLFILTHGAISLSIVTANDNGNSSGEYGASLNNSGVTAQPVTLTGANNFYDNWDSGLFIQSTGLVTLNTLTSEYNGVGGTHGFGLEITNAAASTGVNLTGSNTFYNDHSGALSIYSKGPITLNNIQATNSSTAGAIGALLDNTASGSGSPQNVTIAGTNDFSYNNSDLLNIKTYGAISLNNVTASNSTTGSGASLDNSTGTTAKSVTLTGTNAFNNNNLDGLDITTLGGVTASSLTVGYNGLNGATLSAGGNVTFSGINQFYGNAAGYGLSIHTSGVINLNNVTANSNGSYGADLDNTFALTPQAVTLSGTNQFDNNHTYGLFLRSNGAVTLASLTVQYNDQGNFAGVYGADIDNTNLSLIQPVSLTGTSQFYGNHDRGLVINTLGAITLNNVTATSNSKQGAYLTNSTAGQGVQLTGTNTFSSNAQVGLYISSLGAITLNNLTAIGNSAIGVQVDNSAAGSPMAVNITGTNTFSNNNVSGLSVLSKGAITLNNITANNNSGTGLTLDNSLGSAAVSLTGINNFLYNSGTGLVINSQGNVNLAKVRSDANTNSGDGVNITTIGSVTLTCGSFTNNARYGVNISGASSVTLTGVVTSGNASGDYHFTGIGPLTRVRTCP